MLKQILARIDSMLRDLPWFLLHPSRLGPLLARTLRGLWAHWPFKEWRHLKWGAIAIALYWLAGALWEWRDVYHHWSEARTGKRPLLAARSWHYNLDRIDLGKLAASNADLLVIDYALRNGRDPITRTEIAKLKRKSDGTPRLVVSYLSIGEAEDYRFYWKADWSKAANYVPSWLDEPNCAWPGAFAVRFWDEGWRQLVYRDSESYLQRIINAGFDGVYLDRVDIYDQYLAKRPQARDEMINFVTELARTARDRKPGFIIIAQNAEDLLSERRYRAVIDGLGKEDLLYGLHATDKRNSDSEIGWSYALIKKLLWDWKPVFAVEYLTTVDGINRAQGELASLGLIPTFQHRSLDGDDPILPRTDPALKVGSAEWIQEECKAKDRKSW
jgi:cysteinyl-tRNA synthetase